MGKRNKNKFETNIKAIHKIFKQENITAKIALYNDDDEKTMYYIEYTKNICPYLIAANVDSFAIALGGVKLGFIPVIENKPYSAFLVEKPKPINKNEHRSLDEILYKRVRDWAFYQDKISLSLIQRKFSIGFVTSSKILQRLINESVVCYINDCYRGVCCKN